MKIIPRLRRMLLGLGPKDLDPILIHFEPAEPEVKNRLTDIVHSFVEGYNQALETSTVNELAAQLELHPLERRGFAFEGAGMGMALRVLMMPGSQLFSEFLRSPGDPHHYMVHIGAGWAMARLGVRHRALTEQMDVTFHWLAWDGFGFHQAMFQTEDTVKRQAPLPKRSDYATRSFDQGVGRALWFLGCARPSTVADLVGAFPAERHSDLWGGVGLAATYACGVDATVLRALILVAGKYRGEVGVGSILAAKTRRRANTPAPHLAMAFETLTGLKMAELERLQAQYIDQAGEGPAVYPAIRERLLIEVTGKR